MNEQANKNGASAHWNSIQALIMSVHRYRKIHIHVLYMCVLYIFKNYIFI